MCYSASTWLSLCSSGGEHSPYSLPGAGLIALLVKSSKHLGEH